MTKLLIALAFILAAFYAGLYVGATTELGDVVAEEVDLFIHGAAKETVDAAREGLEHLDGRLAVEEDSL